jgi:hypothetical protein
MRIRIRDPQHLLKVHFKISFFIKHDLKRIWYFFREMVSFNTEDSLYCAGLVVAVRLHPPPVSAARPSDQGEKPYAYEVY